MDNIQKIVKRFRGLVSPGFQTISSGLSTPLQKSEQAYIKLNASSSKILSRLDKVIPSWNQYVSANGITAFRTSLIIPTMMFLASPNHPMNLYPVLLTLTNLGLDYVDGVVARHEKENNYGHSSKEKKFLSLQREALNKNFGGYFDATADKVFVLPLWIYILYKSGGIELAPILSTIVMGHILIESTSIYYRTKTYLLHLPEFSNENSPHVITYGDGVNASIIGKVKLGLSMIGTSLLLIPTEFTQLSGLIFLGSALPLAAMSILEKISVPILGLGKPVKRVFLEVEASSVDPLKHETISLLENVRNRFPGDRVELIVGLRRTSDAVILGNADLHPRQHFYREAALLRIIPFVDEVIPLGAQQLISSKFKSDNQIDVLYVDQGKCSSCRFV